MKAPSPFFVENEDILRAAAQRGPILDLACGRGRHALATARLGLPTVALDRNPRFLRELAVAANAESLRLDRVRADLETAAAIPLRSGAFGAILVFRYLHRPLCGAIEALLAPGGILMYETFTLAQRDYDGGPNNPDFLLADGELPGLFPGLRTIEAHEALRGDPPSESVGVLLAMKDEPQ